MSRWFYDKINKVRIPIAVKQMIDGALSQTSQNPVQNKVIDSALKQMSSTIPDPYFEVSGENATFIINKGGTLNG